MTLGITNRQLVDSIDFARTYDWDIWIENLPSVPHKSNLRGTQFAGWFPATVHTQTNWDVEVQTFNVFTETFSIPKSRAERNLDITFLDNSIGTAENFFNTWVDTDIFNDGRGVSLLEDVIKKITLIKYGPRGVGTEDALSIPNALGSISNVFSNPPSILGSIGRALSGGDLVRPIISRKIIFCYPRGPLQSLGTSESGLKEYNVQLLITGVKNPNDFA